MSLYDWGSLIASGAIALYWVVALEEHRRHKSGPWAWKEQR